MTKRFLDFSTFRFDLVGGLTAGIVAMPLGLAFGEQSGLGAAAGLYGSAFIAFFASLFGGTGTHISGPTAPMTALSMVIIASILQVFEGRMEEALPVILAVFLLAGAFQIVMGILKFGQYIKFIPQTVVSGFMSGIGVIILITQLLPAVGYYPAEDPVMIEASMPHAEELILDRILKEEAEDGILVLEEFKETVKRSEMITPEEIALEARLLAANNAKGVKGTLRHAQRALANIDLIEILLALITIAIIYIVPLITDKVPTTLVSLLLVGVTANLLHIDFTPISAIPSGMPDFMGIAIFSEVSLTAFLPYVFTAMMLALLGSIDSLLTSVVADNLTRTEHDSDQELIGQGIGNSISALFSGLPGAGATVRTVVNIRAGGRTKLSGMVAGSFILIVVLFLGPVASKIPAAVLAGILITVGIGVIDYKSLRMLGKMDSIDRLILLLVLVLTVFWQLVGAVLVGLVVAAFVFMKRMSDTSSAQTTVGSLQDAIHDIEDPLWEDELAVSDKVRERVFFKHLYGPLFFGMVRDFRRVVSALPDIDLIVIRMERVPFVDQSGVEGLRNAILQLYEKDVIVILTGAKPNVMSSLVAMELVPQVLPEEYVFERFADGGDWIKKLADGEIGLGAELAKLKALAEKVD